MATTTTTQNNQVKQWLDEFYKEALNGNHFSFIMGDNANSPIQVKQDLLKKRGQSISFTLLNRLKGASTRDSGVLVGNEEKIDQRTFEMFVHRERHAVELDEFEEQKGPIDQMKGAKDLLMAWEMELTRNYVIDAMHQINGTVYSEATESQKDAWLSANIDRVLFGALKSNGSSLDHSTALGNVDSTNDVLSADILTLMKRMAKGADPIIRPIKQKNAAGKSDYYIIWAHPLAMRDLKKDSAFLSANREARNRGTKNPIFSDADYIYDNMAIYELEDIPLLTGVGNGGIDVAPTFLMGAQAIGMAWARKPKNIKESIDYASKKGVGIEQWYGIDKMQFGSGTGDRELLKDHGILTCYTAAVADA